MKDENKKRQIYYSLAALLIGSLLFIFALANSSTVLIITHYIIALLLFVSVMISNYKAYKNCKLNISLFIIILTVVLAALITYATLQFML